MKLWQKDYNLDQEIEAFTVGNDHILDRQLLKYDCLASVAHAEMLGKVGVLTAEEVTALSDELKHIIELQQAGMFEIYRGDEDCHTAIENHLTAVLGDIGNKIHTFRSRNDQVVTALRLFYKDGLMEIKQRIDTLIKGFENFRKQFGAVQMPGFTHTRKAMPSSMGKWCEAFEESLADNIKLLDAVYSILDQSPLGTGAGYGISYDIHRQFTAKKMGFERVQQSPIYVQNSRGKFESAVLNLLSLIMLDLNRLAGDLILFTIPEYDFFRLPDEFLTGSSIMPHKKNPDVLEILRGNFHKVNAYEFQVKGICANMVSGYHRDLQLTKEPVMDGLEITISSLGAVCLLIQKLEANEGACKAAMSEELFTVDRAYQLVMEGMAFRDAYQQAGEEYEQKKRVVNKNVGKNVGEK